MLGGLSLEAALEDGELLPEPTRAPQMSSLLCCQQLLHLPHHAEHLPRAQTLLGGHKDISVTRQAHPPPCHSRGGEPFQAGSVFGAGWMPCPGQSLFLPIPVQGLSWPPYLLQPQSLCLVLPQQWVLRSSSDALAGFSSILLLQAKSLMTVPASPGQPGRCCGCAVSPTPRW